jgi:hypothetical protein
MILKGQVHRGEQLGLLRPHVCTYVPVYFLGNPVAPVA